MGQREQEMCGGEYQGYGAEVANGKFWANWPSTLNLYLSLKLSKLAFRNLFEQGMR